MIFYERGSSDWTLTHGLFRRAGLVPNIALEVDTIETAKRMVERGLGFAFLPQMAVAREIRRGELLPIKLLDAEPLRRSLDVIHPRHRPLRAQAQSFLKVVRQVVKQVPASAKAESSLTALWPDFSTAPHNSTACAQHSTSLHLRNRSPGVQIQCQSLRFMK